MAYRLCIASLVCLLLACSPTFAPLVRATHSGSPGRLEAGELELSGAAGGYALPTVGGPQIAYGLLDWLSIEAGGNLSLAENQATWMMGYLGPRLTYAPNRKALVHFVSDLELGFGMGVGGVLHGNPAPACLGSCAQGGDGLSWSDRLAYGSYQGIGLGGRFHWFSLFVRARVEASSARGVPLTLWPSAMLGIEFDWAHRVAIGAGGGYMGYMNSVDSTNGWFYQLNLTVFLGVRKKADPARSPGSFH